MCDGQSLGIMDREEVVVVVVVIGVVPTQVGIMGEGLVKVTDGV